MFTDRKISSMIRQELEVVYMVTQDSDTRNIKYTYPDAIRWVVDLVAHTYGSPRTKKKQLKTILLANEFAASS